MNIARYIICLFAGHDFRSLNHRQRKCVRCKRFQVKDYYGRWRNYVARVTELYPVNNDREV